MTIRRIATALTLLSAFAGMPAAAQMHAPYAGMQARTIKALAPEQIDDLRSGRGMGLALAAELNGYPGPLHVLELGQSLQLTAEQQSRVRGLYEEMRAEAIRLGLRMIEQEAALDQAFARRAISPESLADFTVAIGRTQAALRLAHLKYHLLTLALLEPRQVERYRELRGYTAGNPTDSGKSPHQRRH